MEEEGVGGEDRISRLPEPIIHHILSLLPTKCAVSTTVLSKGWKNLWVSVPVLDFREWKSPNTEETLSSTESFMDFVDRVLVLRNMSDIKKFCITCHGKYFDDQRIKGWISTAIKCRVEELKVCRCYQRVDIIPVDLYTCESLTLLDIQIYGGHHLHLPQSISFPRLKILRLDISFCLEKFTQQHFAGCPVLEELCLKYCRLGKLNIISSTLKSLTIEGPLSITSDAKIKIDAPNLTSITIKDGIGKRNLVVHSFPSLVDADIDGMYTKGGVPSSIIELLASFFDEVDDGLDVIPNFVKKLSNVKHLKLWGFIFERLELENVLGASFPTFNNLITLEVSIIKARHVRTLFSFLQFSPNLESLVFGRVIFPDEVNEDTLTLDSVPHCLLMHLKSIEFQEFEGQLSELDLVQQFLQNAGVLETVILGIPSHSLVNSEKKKHTAEDVKYFSNRIMEQLLKYKWASPDCVIKFTSSPYSSPKPEGSYQYVR